MLKDQWKYINDIILEEICSVKFRKVCNDEGLDEKKSRNFFITKFVLPQLCWVGHDVENPYCCNPSVLRSGYLYAKGVAYKSKIIFT